MRGHHAFLFWACKIFFYFFSRLFFKVCFGLFLEKFRGCFSGKISVIFLLQCGAVFARSFFLFSPVL